MQGDQLSLKTLLLDAPATGCGFAGSAFACSDGDGFVHLIGFDNEVSQRKLHAGAVLAFATDEKSGALFSAGDDGSAIKVMPGGEPQLLHTGSKWVDVIAVSPRGHVAWATGKTVHLMKKGVDDAVTVVAPSSVSGMAFSPDGKWLGAAVYGGALLMSLSDPSMTKMLNWQGSHVSIGFSPDGRFCVTSMLENALHVWRIDKPEEKHGRMGGYPAKPLSFVWTADGRYLASSGADVLVLWPFIQADGPIGQSAGVVPGEGQEMIRAVASRPQSQQLGIGYADGSVSVYDRKAQMHYALASTSDRGPVVDLCFSGDGRWLGFVREGGEAGLVNVGKP